MSNLSIIVLGVVQGITEFIPVSSSGHLNLFQSIFGFSNFLDLNIFLNTATLLSVIIFFRNYSDYFMKNLKFILIGSLPIIAVGLLLRDSINNIYDSPLLLPPFFLITSLLVLLTRVIPSKNYQLNYSKALTIGLFQAVAILPGISRSGATILAALLLGLSRKQAFYFSFSLFIPASIGAILFELGNITPVSFFQPIYLVTFTLTAAIGVIALKLLRNTLVNNHYWIFGIYTLILSFCLFLA